MDKPKEIRCPHCGERLTGMALILIEIALESEEVIDFADSCPSCGKMITKKNIELAKTRKFE